MSRKSPVHLSGRYTLSGTRGELFERLQDPEILAQCIPGCQELVRNSEGGYDARLRIGLGWIRGTLMGQVFLRDLDPPETYTLEFQGEGRIGSVKGTTRFTLQPAGNSGTDISFESDIRLEGLLSILGEKLIPGGTHQFFDQLFSTLERALREEE